MSLSKHIIIQGHRGARGLYPENTVTAFIEAVKLGVDILELDVVISKDEKIVVSHEPWMNEDICSLPDGNKIASGKGKDHNLYKMNYAEIKTYDCGKRQHPGFPSQKSIAEHKPLLSEVVSAIEEHLKKNNSHRIIYNIEIKSEREGDDVFHPAPEVFVCLVIDEIKRLNITQYCILQSFDTRILQQIHRIDPTIKLGFLLEGKCDPENDLAKLGFLPSYYNPEFILITTHLVEQLHNRNIKIAAWTVNEIEDMKKMIALGVDSIITDYPDRALTLIK